MTDQMIMLLFVLVLAVLGYVLLITLAPQLAVPILGGIAGGSGLANMVLRT